MCSGDKIKTNGHQTKLQHFGRAPLDLSFHEQTSSIYKLDGMFRPTLSIHIAGALIQVMACNADLDLFLVILTDYTIAQVNCLFPLEDGSSST